MSSTIPNSQREPSMTQHYQTFPTKPPTSRGKPPPTGLQSRSSTSLQRPASSSSNRHHESPLPKRQLATLGIIALAEQTALNSMSPYLPDMASTFPEVKPDQVGLYVGLIASSFALAQFATNFFWGWLSDRIGRKPVILLGTLLTAACFCAFGFCRTLWQAILVQAFMGLVNGNQGVVSTCLGEITDRSNQSKAFAYLPVLYGVGGVTGPIVGGLLAKKMNNSSPTGLLSYYPYLLPNLTAVAFLIFELVVTMIFLEESMEGAKDLPSLGTRVGSLFSWLWQFTSSSRPSYVWTLSHQYQRPSAALISGAVSEDEDASDTSSSQSIRFIVPNHSDHNTLRARDVLNRDTVLILVTFLIFQLSNIAYNSLYPIFGQASPPTGRALSPQEIGFSLAFSGLVTIVFQLSFFGTCGPRIGNKVIYRIGQAGFVIAFVLTPFVGYKDSEGVGLAKGQILLWIELAVVLTIKTVASVGGLTSALLLITNSARDHSVLGTLNGLAQTLSAAGRAAGPFLSGGLFSLGSHIQPKGEVLPFGVFGGISLIGFLMSFGIRGDNLEAGVQSDEDHTNDSESDENVHYARHQSERSSLLNRK